jgi:hypothetical protein
VAPAHAEVDVDPIPWRVKVLRAVPRRHPVLVKPDASMAVSRSGAPTTPPDRPDP